mmetsp:Transcript_50928/g.100804  ORF Transcript_50928/g.100804 Transcript_50928/m.100804 type:complete len:227 (-) Transcript_50928:21-701(-)
MLRCCRSLELRRTGGGLRLILCTCVRTPTHRLQMATRREKWQSLNRSCCAVSSACQRGRPFLLLLLVPSPEMTPSPPPPLLQEKVGSSSKDHPRRRRHHTRSLLPSAASPLHRRPSRRRRRLVRAQIFMQRRWCVTKTKMQRMRMSLKRAPMRGHGTASTKAMLGPAATTTLTTAQALRLSFKLGPPSQTKRVQPKPGVVTVVGILAAGAGLQCFSCGQHRKFSRF